MFGSGLSASDPCLNTLGNGTYDDAVLFFVCIPNLLVGFTAGLWLHYLGQQTLGLAWDSSASYYVAAAISFLTVAVFAGLWTWWIAARRYRRSRAVQRDA